MHIKVKYVYVIHSNAHAFRKGLNIKRGNVNTVIINTGIYDSLINCEIEEFAKQIKNLAV